MTVTLDAPTLINHDTPPVARIGDERARKLRNLNLGAGVLHLISGLAMIVLGNDFSLPVTAFDAEGPPGTPISEGSLEVLFDVPLAPMTAAFAFLSAFFHFLIASPLAADVYRRELSAGRNRFRWVEYSLSASLMILLILLLGGANDIAALITAGFVNASMILFGWIMEMVNRPDRRVWWTPFWFGCIAGIAPWVAFVTYLWFNIANGDEGPPTFVYGILVSIFVLFNCFAVNQWLQYRGIGPWSDYVFGEKVYIGLSFVAKTALAWQVFANVLID